MKKPEGLKLVDENGKRIDGRSLDDTRPITMEVGLLSRADGSAKVGFGNTVAVAAVFGPRALFPRHLQEAEECIIRTRYNMAPFSTESRKSPGTDRRSIEISKVLRHAIEATVFLEEFPRATIDVYMEIISSDGSTRCTALNAASLALAMAGVPMRDLIASCTGGKIDGKLAIDINGKEDNYGEADVAFAMLPTKREIVLLQMDGELTKEEFMTLLTKMADKCNEIRDMQVKTIKEYYKKIGGELE